MTASRRSPRNPRVPAAIAAAGVAGATLAVAASWVAHKARVAERTRPPEGAFVNVDGVRLHYLVRGVGDAVVLLHGNAVHAGDFIASGLFRRLARTNRVIAFDRPGFGYSERPRGRLWTAAAQAELLHRALTDLGIGSAVVVGHSWGTLVALELALRARTPVRRLVLISGYYFPTVRLEVALAAPPAIPILGAVLRYTVSALLARLTLDKTLEKLFAPEPVPTNFLPVLSRELLLRPAQIRASAQDAAFMIPSAMALRSRYARLTVPTTIVAGQGDQVVDVDTHACALHHRLANSELRVFPDVGHMAHYGALDEIASAVSFDSAAPRGTSLQQAVRVP